LDKKIIALPKGWSTIEFFKTHYPSIHIIEVESTRQALEYVDQGKVAATVEQEGIVLYLITKFGFTDLILSKWLDNEDLQKTSSMHFSVLKTNPVLFSISDKALASITLPEMRALKDKRFSRTGRSIGAHDVGLTPAGQPFRKYFLTDLSDSCILFSSFEFHLQFVSVFF